MLALAVAPIILLALVLTQARSSAWVGLGAGVIGAAFIAAGKKTRPAILLVGLLIALFGVWRIQGLRETGEMGDRAHSLRTRLNHEWPYAITLFSQKPIGGHGEGCYRCSPAICPQAARRAVTRSPKVVVHMPNELNRWPISQGALRF
jgi:hypothetical protein